MSADHYKAEAKRLANHLADVHGVKLKHASVLNAIAAVHGARDWNTLVAKEKPGLLGRATSMLCAAPLVDCQPHLDALLFNQNLFELRFGASVDQTVPVDIPDNFLRQHTLVLGGHGSERLLESLAAQQILRGGGLLFLDANPSKERMALFAAAAAKARRNDITEWENPGSPLVPDRTPTNKVRYTPLAGRDAAAIADRLLTWTLEDVDLPSPRNLQDEKAALTALVGIVLALNQPLTLEALKDLLTAPRKLQILLAKLTASNARTTSKQETEVLRLLNVLVAAYPSENPSKDFINESLFRKNLSGVLARITYLEQEGALPNAKKTRLPHLGLEDLLVNGECAHLSLPGNIVDEPRGAAGEMLVHELGHLVRDFSALRNNTSESLPFLVVMPLSYARDSRLSTSVFAQARAQGVAFVVYADKMDLNGDLRNEFILANTANKVFYRPTNFWATDDTARHLESRNANELVARNGSAWVLAKSTNAERWRDRLENLGEGEAILEARGHVRQMRTFTVQKRLPQTQSL